MPGFLLHADADIRCFHNAKATIGTAQAQALVGGKAIATTADQITIKSCPNTNPGPCSAIGWLSFSTKVLAGGQPVLLQALPPVAPGSGATVGTPPSPQLVYQVQLQVTGT
jgi:hypothetical protein